MVAAGYDIRGKRFSNSESKIAGAVILLAVSAAVIYALKRRK